MKAFEFNLSGESYEATIDNTMVCMFRKNPEMDYFKVEEEEQKLYVFNNPELARRLGGLSLSSSIDMAYTTDLSFRREYGWNAILVLEDYAREYEIELYIQANVTDLEDKPEWMG